MVCRVLQAEDLSVVERLGATAVVRTFFSFFRTQWPSRIPIEQPNRAKNRPPPHARPLPPEPGSEPLGYGMREQAPRPDVIACGSEHRRGERWALPQQDKSLTLSLEDESLFPQHLRQDTPRTCLAVKLATAPSACASVHGGVVAVYQYRCSVSLLNESLSLSLWHCVNCFLFGQSAVIDSVKLSSGRAGEGPADRRRWKKPGRGDLALAVAVAACAHRHHNGSGGGGSTRHATRRAGL